MLNKLKDVISSFLRRTVVDEAAVKALVKELQKVLISSDVDIKLVLKLSKNIKKKLLEEKKPEGITLREHAIKTIYDEIVAIAGESYKPKLDKTKIMLIGLYGSGKTTTAAKLAYFYKTKGLKVLLIGADNDRPAAKEQLKQLANEINVNFCTSNDAPKDIIKHCISNYDVHIIDTAGRNAFDESLNNELKEIYNAAKPDEVFLVFSADIGKIAKQQAQAFMKAVPISAVIITKMDGSGKAGGALSAVSSLGIKIAFIGTGEKIDALEPYDARSFVSKMFGFVDVKEILKKFKPKGELPTKFNFEMFLEQLKSSKDSFPQMMQSFGLSMNQKDVLQGEEMMKKYEAMILSMTPEERRNVMLLKGNSSRIERIARGSGTKPEEVRKLVNMFIKMKKMYKQFSHDRGIMKKLNKLLKGGNFKFPF